MLEFTDKVVGEVIVPIKITENDVENIIVSSMEGGSNYWMGVDNTGQEWEEKPKGEPVSTWATKLLIDGKMVRIADKEEGYDKTYPLTLEKLFNGIKLNKEQRPWDSDLSDLDGQQADCIVQYAVFGKVVFG